MTATQSEEIDIFKLIGTIRSYWFSIFLFTTICFALGSFTWVYMPKKFKSSASLDIPSSYFKNPVDGELQAMQDSAEIAARRLNLIRQALSDEFIDEIGKKYSLYDTKKTASHNVTNHIIEERERLRGAIEYYPKNQTTMNIAVVSDSPKVSFLALKDIINQLQETMISRRLTTLNETKDGVEKQVAHLAKSLRNAKKDQQALKIEFEMREINSKLASLRKKYTDNHPKVIELQSKVNRQIPQKSEDPAAATTSIEGVYQDFLRKLGYLNLALSLEQDNSKINLVEEPNLPTKPVSPDLKVIAIMCLIADIGLSAIWIWWRENTYETYLEPSHSALFIETNYLGELPLFNKEVLLLEESYQQKRRLSLPRP